MNSYGVCVAGVGITPPNYKASGGISAGLQLMCRVADSCETAMFVMADRDEDVADGRMKLTLRRPSNILLPFESVLPRSVTTMMWRPQIRPWLKAVSPLIAHLHNPHPVGALFLAAEACNSLNVPYVISTHGFVEFNDFSNGFGLPEWQKPLVDHFVRRPLVAVARGAARILMLSPQEEPILLGMGVSRDRLAVVTNGVDPYFSKSVEESERVRLVARFKLPENATLLLFVGNHTLNKGLDVLLSALGMMKERAVAIIAGAIRSKAENDELVRSSGLTSKDPRFQFTDYISKEELRALYQSVDVFVFPSRADTLPLVILEAMASGLPIVATSVGGIPFQVTPDDGILVPPGDASSLAEALDRVSGDQNLRTHMGASGRNRVIKHFDWETSAHRAVAIYEEVVGVSLRQAN